MDISNILSFKNIRLGAIYALFLTCIVSKSFATALQDTSEAPVSEVKTEEHELAKKQEAFDPTATVLEHIADSHSWHIWGNLSLPLPVILYTNKGIEFFSSSNLMDEHHEPVKYQGAYYTYLNDHEHIKALGSDGSVDELATSKIWDLSITKNIFSMFISMAIILWLFIAISGSYRKRYGKTPKGAQSFLEPIIIFVRDDIAKTNIGYKYERFMPLLLTFFFFIWFNNILGLIPVFPGGANVSGNINVTFVLAAIVLVVTNLNGNKYYWGHIFKPQVPFWLLPIMWIVEIIGVVSKPFALLIRLFANITAGHIIVLSLISLIFIFKTIAMAPVSIAFVLFMDILELLVGFLQAFIFTMLAALFIGMAVEEHAH
jgi:F-type H+-transporting ATPase subunit a